MAKQKNQESKEFYKEEMMRYMEPCTVDEMKVLVQLVKPYCEKIKVRNTVACK